MRPASAGWIGWARRYPVLAVMLLALFPNAVAGVFNYTYNRAQIVDRLGDAQDTFWFVQGVINAVAFPLGIGLCAWLVSPISRRIHSTGAATAEGLPFAAQYLELMRAAAFETARAERVVLRARRGGVQVRAAQDEISRAVDAQISTQALLHGFSLEEGGELRQRFAAAHEHAANAGRLGEEALAELQSRRRGLAGSLVLVAAALVALTIKIRQLG